MADDAGDKCWRCGTVLNPFPFFQCVFFWLHTMHPLAPSPPECLFDSGCAHFCRSLASRSFLVFDFMSLLLPASSDSDNNNNNTHRRIEPALRPLAILFDAISILYVSSTRSFVVDAISIRVRTTYPFVYFWLRMHVVSLLMQFTKWKWLRFWGRWDGALRLSANARLMAVFREHSNPPFLVSGA